ncbi:uncharacterized protein LOC119298722 [Triticum dicoccoides]|uniref:uncharacterized protein LOC119298722 n=1 Tax=Triticum dicoccoides TaxID=85692 RepID=UPI0018904331|nr:uncharacterized protein LOC119298722 [Triticum dicoccoides]
MPTPIWKARRQSGVRDLAALLSPHDGPDLTGGVLASSRSVLCTTSCLVLSSPAWAWSPHCLLDMRREARLLLAPPTPSMYRAGSPPFVWSRPFNPEGFGSHGDGGSPRRTGPDLTSPAGRPCVVLLAVDLKAGAARLQAGHSASPRRSSRRSPWPTAGRPSAVPRSSRSSGSVPRYGIAMFLIQSWWSTRGTRTGVNVSR